MLIHKYAFENNINLQQKTYENINFDIHNSMCSHNFIRDIPVSIFFVIDDLQSDFTRPIVETLSSNSQLVTKNVIAIQQIVWTFGSLDSLNQVVNG